MTPDKPLQDELVAVAHRLADIARPATLGPFRGQALQTRSKGEGGFDPVTVADRQAEAEMREHLARVRPRDGILGEEFGPVPSQSGLTWVLDPIDGTRGYMSGTPTWGVLIAVANDAGPLYGIIDQPYTAERFHGGFGTARFDGPRGPGALATRQTATLAEATLFSTFPEVGSPEEGRAFAAVSDRCRLTRYGMDCYAYALLALGQIDLVIEAGLQAYDVAAPIAVIEAAGGVVCDWQGGPAHRGGRILAAANPHLRDAALEILSAAPS
ncbi:histidinol-phosphatase [Brevirhabdus pacifica]|uniref:3'(2'),5'-bisphosphate nucleotidase n=1 Tax=Brevirhabdus pacifica TaxID=1267768 RepID=A0A1U7DG55_9RHOB|nr:inositol monophosphatase family protein [Brevirhabdus pacifica]APX88977.1 histidinol-phosphatase [Brevirhabdus pacifica]OWU80198.1 inositol monophosphatase [Loktanella sp. 22II-4b]PJJ86462.1 histidinol phosphatase-like enzyme (inositol monophosphatase family) [Brevirhabdus pacifica]